jgi:hypothetical protein
VPLAATHRWPLAAAAAAMVSNTSATRSVRKCTIFPCKGSRPQSQGRAPGCRPCHKELADRLEAALARVQRLPAAAPGTVPRDNKRFAHTRRSHRPAPMHRLLFPPTSSLFRLVTRHRFLPRTISTDHGIDWADTRVTGGMDQVALMIDGGPSCRQYMRKIFTRGEIPARPNPASEAPKAIGCCYKLT